MITPKTGAREAAAARRHRVAVLTQEGLSAKEIADLVGVSERQVTRDRARIGVARPTPRFFTAAEIEQARRLLEDGAGYNEAARTLGCSHESLRARFPGMGLSADEIDERRRLGWRSIS